MLLIDGFSQDAENVFKLYNYTVASDITILIVDDTPLVDIESLFFKEHIVFSIYILMKKYRKFNQL